MGGGVGRAGRSGSRETVLENVRDTAVWCRAVALHGGDPAPEGTFSNTGTHLWSSQLGSGCAGILQAKTRMLLPDRDPAPGVHVPGQTPWPGGSARGR